MSKHKKLGLPEFQNSNSALYRRRGILVVLACGGNGGFYEPELKQYGLVRRLLMYGRASEEKSDIPSGSVYGLQKIVGERDVSVGIDGACTPSPVSQ